MATPSVSTASSPASDQRFWSGLRNRVDALLEDGCAAKLPAGVPEPEAGKRLREDSQLLIRGFDSVSSSLSQLTGILDFAVRGVRQLAEPPLTDVLKRRIQVEVEDEDEDGPKRKRMNCGSSVADGKGEKGAHEETAEEHKDDGSSADKQQRTAVGVDGTKEGKLEKAKTLAITMATKASSLVRELKTMKSELCFVRNRCALLEEENKRLREGGLEPGLLPEEDDLVRLQLETLLAEKSRLANENATLRRENQGLHQLVEYHQLTSQELSVSYEEAIQGMSLDFSPYADDGRGEERAAPCSTPRALRCVFSAFEGSPQKRSGDLS